MSVELLGSEVSVSIMIWSRLTWLGWCRGVVIASGNGDGYVDSSNPG